MAPTGHWVPALAKAKTNPDPLVIHVITLVAESPISWPHLSSVLLTQLETVDHTPVDHQAMVHLGWIDFLLSLEFPMALVFLYL